jgi:hypothetical protein
MLRTGAQHAPQNQSDPPSPSQPVPTSGWTIDTAIIYFEAMRQNDREFYAEKWRSEEKFQAERDRRLTEVAVEREKALKIKETADLAALQLAREIQVYKDEKANELRSQIERERGNYAATSDLGGLRRELTTMFQPAIDYVIAEQARGEEVTDTGKLIIGVFAVVLTLMSIASLLVGLL